MNKLQERSPAVSVILSADTYERIEPAFEYYRRQTIADRLEIIVVLPSANTGAARWASEPEFASVRVIRVPSIVPMGYPRAAGIRAASAPLIFVGETHSFPRPEMLEMLVAAAADGPWAAVVPGFQNANPSSMVSWSYFLAAYARWGARRPRGEIAEAPFYNALYRRDALMELDEHLESMLSCGDGLRRAFQARGHRIYHESAAHIDHVNIETLAPSAHEQYVIGLMIAAERVRIWPWWRRLVYIGGAWLIPAVLLWRTWPGARRAVRGMRLSAGTFPACVFLLVAKTAGELAGYLGCGSSRAVVEMTRYEVNRLEYVERKDWRPDDEAPAAMSDAPEPVAMRKPEPLA